ncbi:serine hydrolase [Bacillus sp. Xin]|uniref:serine hydrolase n=1 Tax=unclassified Bacillus (in: firmicutes) TaxID=185979 RepID=UPI001574B7D4|nr:MULTISPECIES: serine hydrolase [unclassified Bacillus (in: firmicutes)]MBC6975942.1 serine hydrolase [Bacillus sp. Xin]NSW38820.1 serine hydrolase [Bacillus sp. Xin1]
MKKRKRTCEFFKSVLCLFIFILITNELSFPKVARAESGMLTDRNIENFKKNMDEQVPKWQENYDVPGVAIGIVHEGRIAYTLNYGYADKKKQKVVSDDTLFQAGSMSKSLTAWGVLHLVDEGRLSLDDPVEKFLNKWKLPNSKFDNNGVTIRRLLSHTAGLPPHKGYLGVAPGKDLNSIEESLSGKGWYNEPVEIVNKPGSEAIYSGSGYTILQLVIEEVTGMPFDRYMEEQIMRPLGMKSSSFRQSPEDPNLSKAYGFFGQEIPNYQYTEQAAAGLKTNVTDMMALILASMDVNEHNGKGYGVIKSERVEEMQKPVLDENGLGVFETKLSNQWKMIYHSGDNRGWHSFYGYIPNTKDGLVILTNSENGKDLRQDIYHAWIKYETGKWPESYFSFAEQRKNNLIISVVMGATLGVYLLLFVIRLNKGRRTFIMKHEKKPYIRVGVKTFLLFIIALFLFCSSYMWSTLSLSASNKTNVMLIMAWVMALLIGGFFPKNRSNTNKTIRGKTVGYKTKGN